jgi:hypothetical protein
MGTEGVEIRQGKGKGGRGRRERAGEGEEGWGREGKGGWPRVQLTSELMENLSNRLIRACSHLHI